MARQEQKRHEATKQVQFPLFEEVRQRCSAGGLGRPHKEVMNWSGMHHSIVKPLRSFQTGVSRKFERCRDRVLDRRQQVNALSQNGFLGKIRMGFRKRAGAA